MKLLDALAALFDGDARLQSSEVPPHAEAAFHEARAAYQNVRAEALVEGRPINGEEVLYLLLPEQHGDVEWVD